MAVPISQMWTVASYVVRQKLAGRERYPTVLMLEPLYRCNLSCAGCGKIQYPAHMLKKQLSVEQCMKAVDECPAPMVSIPGGEPLLHPEIDGIVRGLVERKKYIYLCTNALLLEEKLDLFTPSKYLSFSVHMDGLEEDHDQSVCREGVYEKAQQAIRKAVARGFRVTTNTTLFEGVDPERTRRFFDEMTKLGVEGLMVSPGYAYDKAPDQEHFLGRERTKTLFRKLLHGNERRWQFNQSPLFLEFLAGSRDYECTPWGMPTYSVFGWQKPCYLLQEGYAESFDELLSDTQWDRYGHASGNPACQNCMVHSGFEASAVEDAFSSVRGLFAMAKAWFRGPTVHAPTAGSHEPAPLTPAPGAPSLRGRVGEVSPALLHEACDYRGDVTLRMRDGSARVGYVSNLRTTPGRGEELSFWPKDGDTCEQVAAAQVVEIELSGRDTADGRHFEHWNERRQKRASSAADRSGSDLPAAP